MPQTDHIPVSFREGAERLAEAFLEFDRTIIAAHVNLDGDALGSMGAAGWILRALGREFMLYSPTGRPAHLAHCPLPGLIHGSLAHLPFGPETAILLDCGEPRRLGPELAEALPTLTGCNIDHHLGGTGMGSRANWVEPEAAATAQLMAYIAMVLEIPLRGDLAHCIALGLITDTGGFCHGNTSEHVFSLCALLEHNGCRLPDIRQSLDNTWSLGRMRLWARLMQRARLEHGGEIAFCYVTLEDLRQCSALKEDLEGFVEQLRRLAGVRVAVLLREDMPGACRVNLRSHGATDVRSIAVQLGGGGHRNAAGASLHMSLAEGETVLLGAVGRLLASEAGRTF